MTLEEKIKKGVDYLVSQSEDKLNSLSAVDKAGFKPVDPTIEKKYKQQIEFRLRFVESVEELLKQHVLLSDGLLDFISRIDSNGSVSPEDIEGLKQFSKKYKK
tara:strand:- start:171 stop:479 length:309 start_codon:yes stop_codon:yes gene_type:complete